jgi:hypothetical protein
MEGNEALRSVESPIGTMHLLDGGVIFHQLRDSVIVTTESAVEVERLTAELAGDRPVAVVVDLGNIAFADLDTRAFFAANDVEGLEVATALVVGPRIAQFLARRWTDDFRPARKTSVFTDRQEAIAWAREQVADAPA